MIDDHNNLENAIQIGIPQGSLASLILFLIYISGAIEQIEKELPKIISLLFMDDLGFIALKTSI